MVEFEVRGENVNMKTKNLIKTSQSQYYREIIMSMSCVQHYSHVYFPEAIYSIILY